MELVKWLLVITMLSKSLDIRVREGNNSIAFIHLGDNCIVFEASTASNGDLMDANRVYWRRVSGDRKRVFATI